MTTRAPMAEQKGRTKMGEEKAGGAARGSPEERLPSEDHPGGPLSRAECVVLSNMKKTLWKARIEVAGLSHIVGAVTGSQKIERAQLLALRAIDDTLESIRVRKDGAVEVGDTRRPCKCGGHRVGPLGEHHETGGCSNG